VEKFTIQNRTVELPVEVRRSANWLATYTVDAAAAQRLIAPSGLEVAQPRSGRALVALAYIRYDDSDLDTYNEFAVTVIVRNHDAAPATPREMGAEVRKQRCGVLIHQLPVDQSFTLEAGRTIWGYPKTLAQFAVTDDGRHVTVELRQNDAMALRIRFSKGRLPWIRGQALPTYTFLDDALRLTRWETRSERPRGRLGGAELTLGDGLIADELRSLGLPKRPLMTAHTPQMASRFGAAEVVMPARRPAVQA
jgi:hypothetical protein